MTIKLVAHGLAFLAHIMYDDSRSQEDVVGAQRNAVDSSVGDVHS
jgi:hypothetical protein